MRKRTGQRRTERVKAAAQPQVVLPTPEETQAFGSAGNVPPSVQNEILRNGYLDACVPTTWTPVGGGQFLSFTNNPGGYPGGVSPQPVEDTTALFTNLRWYLVSNMRQVISQLYAEIGLVQTIVNVPVDDGLRGGVMLKSKQLGEEEIRELEISLDRDDDINTAGWAAKWNRLYGGAGILILVGDQDPETPLDIDAIGPDTELEFRDVDMWELFWDKQNTAGYDPQLQAQDFEFYSYYSEKVHKSRVMRLKAIKAPSFIRPRLRGWGVSVVEALVRSINQYLKATDLTYEVMDEFKIDVYQVKNLVNTLLGPGGTQKVHDRIQAMNLVKNYQSAIVMDKEDEYQQKQLTFAGLAETMNQIRMQVAADMRMPITKLFGTSMSNGFSTDQNDMENYNSMVEAEVRGKIKYDLLRICEIKCKKLFGFIPDDLELEFKPLRELNAVDQETVRTQKFNRLIAAKQAGEITTEEFRDACNKGDIFDVHLDTTDGMNPTDPSEGDVTSESQTRDPETDLDVEDPGANREDTRKSRAKAVTLNRRRVANPGDVDEALWERAKKRCMKEYGRIKWPVVSYLYKKMGGEFHRKKGR